MRQPSVLYYANRIFTFFTSTKVRILTRVRQLSGQPSVLYYANRIFERAGLGFEAAVGVGLFKALMTLVSVQLVDSPR